MIPEIASCADGMQKSVVLPSRPYVSEPPETGFPSLLPPPPPPPSLLESEPPPPHAAATSANVASSARNESVRRRGRMVCPTLVPPCGRTMPDSLNRWLLQMLF